MCPSLPDDRGGASLQSPTQTSRGYEGKCRIVGGPVALGNEIQIVRSIIRYGEEVDLIDNRMRFGPGFRKPSAKTIRQARAAKGRRMFTPVEIHRAFACAGANMQAMILLGINGGAW